MNELLNQFEKETGNRTEDCGPKIYRDKYVQWLEAKVVQKPEVSEGTLIRPKDIADRLLRLGYRGVSDGISENVRGIYQLLWYNFEHSDGQDIEATAEQIADKITDIIIILDQS